jgi:Esterase FrsA-like
LFNYFPNNYAWSSTVVMGLMSGGQFGEMHRWLEPLRDAEPDMQAWDMAWVGMAAQQEDLASADLKIGYRLSAGARYTRAAAYRLLGERQLPPGPDKLERYKAALVAFDAAALYAPFPIERVEVDSSDGPLPGYLVLARTREPAPAVIFYSGLDVTKEGLYLFVREEFARRGISVLVMDTPGVGGASETSRRTLAAGLRSADRRDHQPFATARGHRSRSNWHNGHQFGRLLRNPRRGLRAAD